MSKRHKRPPNDTHINTSMGSSMASSMGRNMSSSRADAPWILADGTWNDAGAWDDTDVWNDS